MGQALYRKWRPRDWDEVIGQDPIIKTLKNAVASQHIGHAYLFSGPRGTGKTTTARLFAKALNCQAKDGVSRPCNKCVNCVAVNENRMLDMIEIDAASNTSVDDVRDLREKVNFSPSLGAYKVYIIDEVHMLSTAAFNALLKTLEEPPGHVIFILATTEIQKIPATVLSRCQQFDFRRIATTEIVTRLKILADQEKIHVDEKALDLIARQAMGSMRDAISLLDQLASTGENVTLELTRTVTGISANESITGLVSAIVNNEIGAGLDIIHTTLDGGSDVRHYARQIVDYLRDILLYKLGNSHQISGTKEALELLEQQALLLTTQRLIDLIERFNAAALESRNNWQPGLSLELALAGALLELNSQPPITTSSPQVNENTRDKSVNSVGLGDKKDQPDQAQTPPKSEAKKEASTDMGDIDSGKEALSMSMITQNWQAIRSAVKKMKGQTEGLLNSCQPLGIRDNALVLGFSTDILKEKMEIAENITLTEQAIEQVLGHKINVVCSLTSGKSKSLPRDHEIESDGMVGTALRDLGGEVVDFH
ncbi:MAG: DNA polymerase III subunit gamma/tau [Anaerolineaceae bacterium]|nr:DNA polymerase III subunit gamma/tau [Anaerolineaceae bacterium]